MNFASDLNETRFKQPSLYPEVDTENLVICVTDKSAPAPFSALICRETPGYHLMGAGNVAVCYPRYIYEDTIRGSGASLFDVGPEGRRHAVTDTSLGKIQSQLGGELTKDDIFFYVYGVLHSPEYRATFASDLKKGNPRIPYVSSIDDFSAFSSAGRILTELHTGYERIDPWPDLEVGYSGKLGNHNSESYRVEKMKYAKSGRETDRTTIIYNSNITISNIPLEAHDYQVGSKSALDWIVERYQVKTDKDSGIVNNPNDWATEHNDPTYIFDLVRRIVTVSMQTNEIVATLPSLNL